jgi:hypothetical protein
MIAEHPSTRLRELAEPRQRLLRLMQDINFGRITFQVRSGEPDLNQPWRTRRTLKLPSGHNGPRSEAGSADFELCQAQTALLDALGRANDGENVTVEVRHGLPFLVEIERDHLTA